MAYLGLWALLQMALINRAVGPWEAPAVGSLVNDGKIAGIAVILYAAIVGIHYWLDRPAFVLL